MSKFNSLILAALVALGLTGAHAAEEAKPGSKLGACSKEAAAKGLKGAERNKYLSDCNKGLTVAAQAAPAPAGKGGSAAAADDKTASKLGACSKEAAAKGLKGDERKKYLSDCNKGMTAAAAPAAPDKTVSKLGACSKEAAAKGLKGDERKKYLSDCNKA